MTKLTALLDDGTAAISLADLKGCSYVRSALRELALVARSSSLVAS
jgi:hypothetical protein